MQLHKLSAKTVQKNKKRIGRGGKRGKTSGRGTKGQKARASRGMRPELRDLLKKIPKLRGHGKNRGQGINSGRLRPSIVNVSDLPNATTTINPTFLVAQGLINRVAGRVPPVKILGNGTLTHAVTIEGCTVSESARAKIKAAGGSVVATT